MARLVKGRGGRAAAIITGVANLVSQAPAVSDVDVLTTFVVDPTAVINAAQPNLFTSLAGASAVGQTVAGPKTYEFRGNQTVPTGTYTLGLNDDPITWVGSKGISTVTLADGVVFAGTPPTKFENVSVVTQATTVSPISITTGGARFFSFRDATGITATGTLPFIRATAGITIIDFLDTAGTVSGLCIAAVGAALMFISMFDEPDLPANTVSGTGGATLSIAFVDSAQNVSQTQVGASFTMLSVAELIAYTPASNPNWNNNPPATVAAALDRIAAKIGPIA